MVFLYNDAAVPMISTKCYLSVHMCFKTCVGKTGAKRGGLFQRVFHSVVGHHGFLEGVSSCFGRLYHLDDLGVGAAFTLLEGSDGFLCHIESKKLCGFLFDFFVNGDALEDGVVFLQLQTLGGVLTVLGGDVT